MKSVNTLFTVLGWEDRFLLGNKYILEKYNIKEVYLICFKDYLNMKNMKDNRKELIKLLNIKNIELKYLDLEYESSINNWKTLDNFFNSIKLENVILNISTFPRETIWTILFFLRTSVANIKYYYFKPNSYDKSHLGLTKNHSSPRLLFKHSGIFDIDKKLAILIITGFDSIRTNLLIDFYEPNKVIYLSQKGTQFDNNIRNSGVTQNTKFENILIENKIIDSYNIKESSLLLNMLIENNKEYNIILTSHGPKTSAISTYLAYLENKNIGLSYVPAREFSGDYSNGINLNSINGDLNFDK